MVSNIKNNTSLLSRVLQKHIISLYREVYSNKLHKQEMRQVIASLFIAAIASIAAASPATP